jgi:branched-chain amino acid transport system permease protein
LSLTLQIVLSGLAAGSVYGLLAVGHTLVFRLTGIVHFALGDLVGLGVFIALFVTAGRGAVTQQSASSLRFVLGLAVALVATAALGSGSYFAVIHQYLQRGSTLGWVAATAAIAFAIQSLLSVVFSRPAYVFPDPIPFYKAGNDGSSPSAGRRSRFGRCS